MRALRANVVHVLMLVMLSFGGVLALAAATRAEDAAARLPGATRVDRSMPTRC